MQDSKPVTTPAFSGVQLDLDVLDGDYAERVVVYKEKFAAAFLADTGLKATEVVMNVQTCSEHNQGFNGTRIWFEKKTP